MGKFFGLLIVGLLLAALLVYGLDSLANSETRKVNAQASLAYAQGQAEAMVLRAQAESRLHAAQAAAITAASLLPWGVLAILGVLGLAVVALCMVIVTRRPQTAPTLVVERQIVYLPAPGQSRREVWQSLSETCTTGERRPPSVVALSEERMEEQ
jgi:hypothetical protein